MRPWLALAAPLLAACATLRGELLPTGARITPLAADRAQLLRLESRPGLPAGQAVAAALSPDGSTLLVLTSGYNRFRAPEGEIEADSTEHVFVFDVRAGAPRQLQALPVPNTFQGFAWDPDGGGFWVSGGVDDSVHRFALRAGQAVPDGAPIALGHPRGLGIDVRPMAAGLATDGRTLLVANYENDSVSVLDPRSRAKVAEIELRPGLAGGARGEAGGEYPVAVALAGDKAWVSCLRDGEVVVLDLAARRVGSRVRVGRQPGRMLLDAPRGRLYVVNGGSDSVSVIDARSDALLAELPVTAPPHQLALLGDLKGSNPNDLALSADGRTLWVSNGGTNSLAALDLASGKVRALLPTGWYPTAIALAGDWVHAANGKSNAGPNPLGCRNSLEVESVAADKGKTVPLPCRANNQYVWQLTHASLLSLPLPTPAEETSLTARVAENNGFGRVREPPLFAELRQRIRHVIYVVKENRTFDQVLGDLGRGDADPRLVLFPEAVTPNHHALARQFVTLDAFFDSGEVSGDGWNWSTAGRTSDVVEKAVPVQYGGRGLSYDYEGTNRNVNVGFSSLRERREKNPETPDDPDLLPGTSDVGSTGDYLWSAALRAGLTVRNYGFFADGSLYDPELPTYLRTSHSAFAERALQFVPTKRELADISDPWFRSFDMTFADYWNYREWEREFARYEERGDLPALELVRFAHDHFGSFDRAEDGVNTPETQMADNDYAVGLLVERVARSRFAQDTVIFVVEDDAQDGPDHVDAHRSIALLAGAQVRQGSVISARHTTVSLLRTIELLLGLPPLGLTDGMASPMSEVFDREARPWSFTAKVPPVLRSTRLPLPPGPVTFPRRDASWWAAETVGQDFSRADAADGQKLGGALWRGLR
jgi:YVTN family beta-propeller protein